MDQPKAEEEDFTGLPLPDKLNHKLWKARMAGYEELAQLLKRLDPEEPGSEAQFKKYADYMKKIAAESNAFAQEVGLVVLAAWAQNSPLALKSRSVILPIVIEKSLAQMRAGTRAKALDVLMMYIEIDTAEPVVDDLLPFLDHKVPKLVAGSIFALKEAVRLYGTKTVNAKPILKSLPKMFDNKDKKVREEATQLVLELYRWLGKAVETCLGELKPVQQKELLEAFQKVSPEKPAPERLLRSQQEVVAREAASGAADVMEEEADEVEEETDMYDVIEPVDLLSKLPKNFYEQLGSQKWKDRKDALEEALTIAKEAPKIVDGNYGELVSALAKRLSDNNIMVVTVAASLLESVARGLRTNFQKYKSLVVSPLLEKCKEKKQTALDALRGALDATFLSLNSLSDIIEDATTAMNHKNPNVKAESVRWLVRCLKITKQLPPKPEVKVLNEMLLKSTDDSFVEVRESAFEGLGTLMKLVGEKVMQPYLEKLDNIKAAKVKEVYEKAEVCYRPPPAIRKTAANPPASKTAKTSISDAKSKENNPPVPTSSDAPAALRPGTRQTGLRKKAPVASTTNRPEKSTEADSSNPKPGAAGESAAVAVSASPPTARAFAARASTGALSRMSSAGSLAGRPNAKKRLTNTVGSSPAISGGDALTVAADDSPGGKMPVLTSDTKAKESRSAHDKGMNKWSFEAPRKDLIDDLAQQMEPHFLKEVHSLLFSTNHYRDKDHLAGITALDDAISASSKAEEYGIPWGEIKARYIANVDTILKYITIRFFDTNTSMLIKCLDLVEHVIGVMDEEGYHLSEYEASSFLPFFINKVGDNKETMRARVRSIMKMICRIYPSSKMFTYLMEYGLKSKNGRTRTECLEELGALIQRHGLNVCGQASKTLPTIAQHVSDRDNAVRSAAIIALSQVYVLVGEKVFALLGKLSEKDKSLLEERFKRTKPLSGVNPIGTKGSRQVSAPSAGGQVDENVPPPPKFSFQKARESRPSTPSRQDAAPSAAFSHVADSVEPPAATGEGERPTSSSSSLKVVKSEFSLDLDKLGLPSVSNAAHASILVRPAAGLAALPPATQAAAAGAPTLRRSASALSLENRAYMMDIILAQIASGRDNAKNIDALKELEVQMSGPPELVIPYIDEIVNAVTLQLRLAFTAPDDDSPDGFRLCKHVVNALVLLFTNRTLSTRVSTEALRAMVVELLHRLLDQHTGSRHALSRPLNILMIRLLDSVPPNVAYGILLDILERSAVELLSTPEELAGAQARFAELVMKCIWKLTKGMRKVLDNGVLSPEKLLLDVHNFMARLPPQEWKRRNAEGLLLGDLPNRTMKTILFELVDRFNGGIFSKLSLVPDPENSPILGYLKNMTRVQDVDVSRVLTAPGAAPATAAPEAPELVENVNEGSADYRLRNLQRLKSMMSDNDSEGCAQGSGNQPVLGQGGLVRSTSSMSLSGASRSSSRTPDEGDGSGTAASDKYNSVASIKERLSRLRTVGSESRNN